MFASIENRHKIQLRINDGTGKSVVIGTVKDIYAAREIEELLNKHVTFENTEAARQLFPNHGW